MASWKEIQKKSFFDWKKLFSFLSLDPKWEKSIDIDPSFSLYLPLRLAKKITPCHFQDPILRQFLPLIEERENKKGFTADPVHDCSFLKNNLLSKYSGRALLLCSSSCAMHCRFCFRKFLPYSSSKDFSFALSQIEKDKTIQEVILSGGDPLSLDDKTFFSLLSSLE
ncbi:MAG: 4Fe-4S cluster-binding domain-containing protein, partial [Chlamydiota bacterium]